LLAAPGNVSRFVSTPTGRRTELDPKHGEVLQHGCASQASGVDWDKAHAVNHACQFLLGLGVVARHGNVARDAGQHGVSVVRSSHSVERLDEARTREYRRELVRHRRKAFGRLVERPRRVKAKRVGRVHDNLSLDLARHPGCDVSSR